MLRAKHVRAEWKDRIPAIVHVDGTARVQTVRREHNERMYDLLTEFEKLTGVPLLVNTSFNIKGEPIVETPRDAVNCFLYTGIDYLALHDMLVSKNVLYKIFSPFVKVYHEAMVRPRDATD
jgi:carbamoyltransferase